MTTSTESVAPPTHAGDAVHAARTKNGRLEFLDALRGIAALVVAVQHLGEVIWPQLIVFSHVWWRPGEFGVLVFFICSGFIIPASMERRGDLTEFWIGRAFRLFPLYLSVIALGVVAFATPWASPGAGYRPVTDTLINTTMLQVFSTRPLIIGASWTLGYEMVFYLVMTVLFMLGWHRRSAGIAIGLVTAALVLGGFLVPSYLIQPQIRSWPAVVIGLVALAVVVIVPRLAGPAARGGPEHHAARADGLPEPAARPLVLAAAARLDVRRHGALPLRHRPARRRTRPGSSSPSPWPGSSSSKAATTSARPTRPRARRRGGGPRRARSSPPTSSSGRCSSCAASSTRACWSTWARSATRST